MGGAGGRDNLWRVRAGRDKLFYLFGVLLRDPACFTCLVFYLVPASIFGGAFIRDFYAVVQLGNDVVFRGGGGGSNSNKSSG